ncbi:hypothetical protein GCM10020229_22050 [Kitasatospora albolonga]
MAGAGCLLTTSGVGDAEEEAGAGCRVAPRPVVVPLTPLLGVLSELLLPDVGLDTPPVVPPVPLTPLLEVLSEPPVPEVGLDTPPLVTPPLVPPVDDEPPVDEPPELVVRLFDPPLLLLLLPLLPPVFASAGTAAPASSVPTRAAVLNRAGRRRM